MENNDKNILETKLRDFFGNKLDLLQTKFENDLLIVEPYKFDFIDLYHELKSLENEINNFLKNEPENKITELSRNTSSRSKTPIKKDNSKLGSSKKLKIVENKTNLENTTKIEISRSKSPLTITKPSVDKSKIKFTPINKTENKKVMHTEVQSNNTPKFPNKGIDSSNKKEVAPTNVSKNNKILDNSSKIETSADLETKNKKTEIKDVSPIKKKVPNASIDLKNATVTPKKNGTSVNNNITADSNKKNNTESSNNPVSDSGHILNTKIPGKKGSIINIEKKPVIEDKILIPIISKNVDEIVFNEKTMDDVEKENDKQENLSKISENKDIPIEIKQTLSDNTKVERKSINSITKENDLIKDILTNNSENESNTNTIQNDILENYIRNSSSKSPEKEKKNSINNGNSTLDINPCPFNVDSHKIQDKTKSESEIIVNKKTDYKFSSKINNALYLIIKSSLLPITIQMKVCLMNKELFKSELFLEIKSDCVKYFKDSIKENQDLIDKYKVNL